MAPADNGNPARQPISPATRRRLQQCFEHGSKVGARGQYDFADEMFTQCVTGDPGNKLYAQSFLANLQKKYNNNKRGSKLSMISGATSRAALNKSSMQKDWTGVLEAGIKLLKLNPWDAGVLVSMASASAMFDHDDAQLVYLKAAQDINLRDPEINRLYGRALARQGVFDQALVAWQRVLQGKPGDDEATRAVHNLTVEKTIHDAGYETAETTQDVRADSSHDTAAAVEGFLGDAGVMTPERQLERQIERQPADVRNYVKLSELHYSKERWDQSEKWLIKAIEVSGGDINLKEQLEDLRLKQQREHLALAKRRADGEKTAEARDLFQRIAAEVNLAELEVYRGRTERYPTNLGLRYELALRLQRSGSYSEAIKQYQEARNDPNRRGTVLLALGECFYRIKQYKLAMSNFEAAARELSDREPDQRKQAYYYTGCLAQALKDWEKAENYLTELAGMDYGYKDVAERLDKIQQERHKG